METTLHRQLKALYAGPEARTEERLEGYRIDAVRGSQLVEIQHGSLAAIRDKIARLLKRHQVLVVKQADREVLIPAVKEFVTGVDVARGRMTVRTLEGMVEA